MRKIGALEAGGTKMVLGVFDETGAELERLTLPTLTPEETVPPMRVVSVRHVGPYNTCCAAWATLSQLAGPLGLFGPHTKMIGLGYDDPAITAPEKIRYDACLTVPDDFAGTPELPVSVIDGGEYAMAVVKGPYTNLAPAFAHVCGVWGPDSGREFAGTPSIEFYLNNPGTTPPEELLTEIGVPLAPGR